MKRYLVFIGHSYPCGGMDDFEGDFDTLEEAVRFIEENVEKNMSHESIEEQWRYTWAHIWDSETQTKVWSK